jgi:hypothetical protein
MLAILLVLYLFLTFAATLYGAKGSTVCDRTVGGARVEAAAGGCADRRQKPAARLGEGSGLSTATYGTHRGHPDASGLGPKRAPGGNGGGRNPAMLGSLVLKGCTFVADVLHCHSTMA